MATQTLYMSPITMIVQYLTDLGLLAQGGTINTYLGGTVSTPQTTYSDSTGLVANLTAIVLPANARPRSASGAPIAFWTQPGITLHLVVTDAQGNQLVNLDQIPAINDLTNATNALQNLLASPASSNASGVGPVAGADLVANAVKSYDVFADLRAANAPTLAAGQTLIVEVQGATAVNDALGGEFFWQPSANNVDDGRNYLKPNSISSGTNGRWLRMWGLGIPQIQVLAADFSVNTQTTPQNSQLIQNLLSGGTYLVQMRLQLLGVGGTGQGWKVVGNVGSVSANGAGGGTVSGNGVAAAVVNQVAAAMTQAAISTGNPDIVNVDYIVTVNALAGFNVQVAQNASSANATVLKAGSTLIITRLA